MSLEPRTAWRAFPWDARAPDGAPFSSTYLPPYQGHGRFDLRAAATGVWYLAEDPVHAVAERIQDLRNQELEPDDLTEGGRPYALAEVRLPRAIFRRIADLCAPREIAELDAAPDVVAACDRRRTQALACRLHERGWAGLRWWSVFRGEWHSLILFCDRLPALPEFGTPEILDLEHPAIRDAARALGIQLRA